MRQINTLLVAIIFLFTIVYPILTVAKAGAASYVFSSAQGSKTLQLDPANLTAIGDISFSSSEDAATAHVVMETLSVPDGWF